MTTLKTYFVNVATAAAVSVAAITSGPAAAAAKDNDMLKALAGIAAIAVFAGVLNQQQQQNRGGVTRSQAVPLQPLTPTWQQPRTERNDWQQTDNGWRRILAFVVYHDVQEATED